MGGSTVMLFQSLAECTTIFWLGRLPLEMTAMGMSPLSTCTSLRAMSWMRRRPMNTTRVEAESSASMRSGAKRPC